MKRVVPLLGMVRRSEVDVRFELVDILYFTLPSSPWNTFGYLNANLVGSRSREVAFIGANKDVHGGGIDRAIAASVAQPKA
jgi:hypothetical protein